MSVINSGQPLVSVIIPNYNNAEFISECLDSVLNQTYKNLEIVCIDDASSDQSVSIINEYMKQHAQIRLIKNSRNIGVSKNRDTAINASRGTYFTTLDSDDFFISPEKISTELSLLINHQQTTGRGLISFSDIRITDSHGKELNPKAVSNIKQGNILKDIFLRTCLIPRDYLLTKEQYIEAGGFDFEVSLYEDWDLKIRLAKANDFIYSGVKGIGYRRHGKGLSAANVEKHIKWLTHVFRKNFGVIPLEERKIYQAQFDKYIDQTFRSKLTANNFKLKNIINKIRQLT